jgi:hypothetical protein
MPYMTVGKDNSRDIEIYSPAEGFSLYLMRAVLSGRGDEVIDLARTNLFR